MPALAADSQRAVLQGEVEILTLHAGHLGLDGEVVAFLVHVQGRGEAVEHLGWAPKKGRSKNFSTSFWNWLRRGNGARLKLGRFGV